MKKILFAILILCFINKSYSQKNIELFPADKQIHAFAIDFNFGPGGAHDFARPGLWANTNPEEQIKWYEEMGCNTILTFAVSCNGFAWYKNGIIPEQPGLKYDFLGDMVKLGRKKNIKIFGYFNVGANNRWEELHPDMCYQTFGMQIPLTNKYLDYLCASIEDAIKKTDIDGIQLDWFYNPGGDKAPLPGAIKWLPCEQEMYQELMNEPFPGVENICPVTAWIFLRKSIDRAWKRIRETTKKAKPNCIIWLSCYNINSREFSGSDMLKEVDWLVNEMGDTASTEGIRNSIGKQTRLITCLAEWNKQDPTKIIPYATKANVGLLGFTRPVRGTSMPIPVADYLAKPFDGLTGDDLDIAILIRVFKGIPLTDFIKKK